MAAIRRMDIWIVDPTLPRSVLSYNNEEIVTDTPVTDEDDKFLM